MDRFDADGASGNAFPQGSGSVRPNKAPGPWNLDREIPVRQLNAWAGRRLASRFEPGGGSPSHPVTWRARLILLCIYLPAALWFTWGAKGIASIYWMQQFDPAWFSTWTDIGALFKALHTGLPPALAFVELACFRVFGGMSPIETGLYRFAWIATFALPILMPLSMSRVKLLLNFMLGVLFVWAGVQAHSFNPQVYDLLYPLFFLGFVACMLPASGASEARRPSVARCALGGFLLSMWELIRPFSLVLMPIALWWTWLRLRGGGTARALAFLLPLIVFSGGWHLNLLVRHGGQILWTNNAGNNLARAWIDQGLPGLTYPELDPDVKWVPLKEGGYIKALNTDSNQRNSRILLFTIYKYILSHPLHSAAHLGERLLYFTWPNKYTDPAWFSQGGLLPYSIAVFLCCAVLGWELILLTIHTISRRGPRTLGPPGNFLVVMTFLTFAIIAVSEAGEEFRFIVSVLPFLATLPTMRAVGKTS